MNRHLCSRTTGHTPSMVWRALLIAWLVVTPVSAVEFEPIQVLQDNLGFTTVLAMGPEDPDPGSVADGCLYVAEGLLGAVRRICFDANKSVTSNDTVIDLKGPGGVENLLGLVIDPRSDPDGEIHIYLAYSDDNSGPLNGKIARGVSADGGATYVVDEEFITGLGRSIGNIQTNGLEFGPDRCLYISQGGNSNAGYDADYAEVRLAGGILRACFKGVGNQVDPSFDRDCGAGSTQEACDVEVYASGMRNPFDLVWHTNGRLYATDNDTSLGFRNSCPDVANNFGCPCQTPVVDPIGDELNLIEQDRYYGHPNPFRANPMALQCLGGTDGGDACSTDADCDGGGTCEDLSPLCTDPLCGETVQCYYFGDGEPPQPGEDPNGLYRTPLVQVSDLLDGITEYRARFGTLFDQTFCSDWSGNLLTAGGPGLLHRFVLFDSGQSAADLGTADLNGAAGLDLVVGRDGTVYISDLTQSRVTYLRPIAQPDQGAPDYFEFCAAAGLAETFDGLLPGDDPPGWLDTGAGNSLAAADDFGVFLVDGDPAFGTTSTAVNIHSHYVAGGDEWSNYTLAGRLRIDAPGGGVGVTLLSAYPSADRYYRLRRFGSSAFELSTHGGSLQCGTSHTGVVPNAGEWYAFQVEAEDVAGETRLRAKVWPDGTPPPVDWQQECVDSSGGRLTAGTVGLWSMGPGAKFWDDLTAHGGTCGDSCDDGNPCTVDSCDPNLGCVHAPDVGLACDDGTVCTINEACSAAGDCVGEVVISCDDGNSCTTDTCDPISGVCGNALNADTCDDGDPGTVNDVCSDGVCMGEAALACGGGLLLDEDFGAFDTIDPANWLDTAAGNSLIEEDNFKTFFLDGDSVLRTTSTEVNIHSHFATAESSSWADYTFTGRMRIDDAAAGIGVTFLSQFSGAAEYYRLRRRQQSPAFHLTSLGAAPLSCDSVGTGVNPAPDVWYEFKVAVLDVGTETQIRAKVWQLGAVEPPFWQQECTDDSPGRLISGTVGLWSMEAGSKFWDKLTVIGSGTPGECDDGLFCTGIDLCQSGFCASAGSPCTTAAQPICDEANDQCVACLTEMDCADALFCNGAETCQAGVCVTAGDPCLGTGQEFCDEIADACNECEIDLDCDDGAFCTGVESCASGVCSSAGDPCAGTASPVCDEAADQCAACGQDTDCDDGLTCNGAEICEQGSCVAGSSCLGLDITPGSQTVDASDDAVFTLTIQNVGAAPLTGVGLMVPPCDTLTFDQGDVNLDGVLQPTETWVYTCTVAAVASGFTLDATVEAGDPSGGTVFDSDAALVTIAGNRVVADLLALYTFQEGNGSLVRDVSGVAAPLDLTIQNDSAVTWLTGGGLSVDSPTAITSPGPATKLLTAMQASEAVTIEAWVRPTSSTVLGRIAALSLNGFPGGGDFVLAQNNDFYEVRLRTSATNQYGIPSLATPAGSATVGLTHIVYTRDNLGLRRLYLNGTEVASGVIAGDFSTWGNYALALANEPAQDRPWIGELHLVAFYGEALDAAQVAQNFSTGLGPPNEVPPVVTAPANITVAAVDAAGTPAADPAIVAFRSGATAQDDVDGALVPVDDAPATFPLGATVVTFSATDSSGNTGSAGATVTVEDLTPPSVLAPADLVVGSGTGALPDTDPAIAAWLAGATALDNVEGALVPTDDAPSSFPIGTTVVTFSATDAAGNNGSASASLTVQDASTPVVTPPGDLTVAAVDAAGTPSSDTTVAAWLASATAVDAPDGPLVPTHDAPATFPLGSTVVTFSATDSDTNTGTATATLTVQDLTAPVVTAPADIVVPSPGGALAATDPAIAAFLAAATALDNVDGSLAPVNDAAAVFSVGTTRITFSATDAAGNTGTATADVTVEVLGGRVADDLLALYTFAEGVGDAVQDVSGVGTPLDLTIQDTSAVTWLPGGGLSVDTATAITSPGPATKLIAAMQASQALTIETWVRPVDTSQAGRRIVALSLNGFPGGGNFVLAQNSDVYDVRLRTTATNQYGIPSLATPAGSLTTSLAHVIYTRDPAGTRRLYVDGVEVASGAIAGDLSSWGNYALALANEPAQDRPWVGELYLVAFYGRALDAGEVERNFDAGLGPADLEAPLVTAPGDVTVAAVDASGTPATDPAVAAFLSAATATDDVDGALVPTDDAPPTFPLGPTLVTFSATDAAGNTGSASATLTVEDQNAPVVSAPADIGVAAADAAGTPAGDPAIVAFLSAATATDDVDGVLTPVNDAPTVFPLGDTVVTFSATDAAGNSRAAQATVTVADEAGPVVTSPADLILGSSGGALPDTDPAIVAWLAAATALDDVDGPLVPTDDAPSSFPIGVTVVTFVATDAAGNIGSASSSLTVQDVSIPVVTPPGDLTVAALDAAGIPSSDATIAAWLASATALDDVDGSLVPVNDAPSTFSLGATVVTFSATDSDTHTGTATATLTVEDRTDPVVAPPADIVVAAVDAGGTPVTDPAIAAFLSAATALDDVDGPLGPGNDAPATFPLGETQVTFTATDAAGNVGTATATVTIEDQSLPVVTAPTATTVAAVDAAGTPATDPTIAAWLATATAQDNVDGPLVPGNDAPLTFPIATTAVTFSATDSAGNTGMGTTTLTVEDQTAPVVTAPADLTLPATGGSVPATDPTVAAFLAAATALDNVDGPLPPANDAPASFPPGDTTVTFSATDAAGNTGMATAVVTVGGRVTDHLLALYSFAEGTGATIRDVSGVGTPLDLTIQNVAATTWLGGGGLSVDSATAILSTGPATKLTTAIQASEALTLEAFVRPVNTTQFGPARIVALSLNGSPGGGNAILGQTNDFYEVRLRTDGTNQYGIPSLAGPAGSLTTAMTHVVYTRDATGARKLFVNGVLVSSGTIAGDFSTWGDYALALANEPAADRPWIGELHLVAFYDEALDASEINRNFAAGPVVP